MSLGISASVCMSRRVSRRHSLANEKNFAAAKIRSNIFSVLKKILSAVWFWLGVILVLISAYVSFTTHVSADAPEHVDPSDLLSGRFEVSNLGPFSIHEIQPSCHVKEMRWPHGRIEEGDFENPFSLDGSPLSKMGVSEKVSVRCGNGFANAFNSPATCADIVIIVSFRAFPYLWSKEEKFRFVTGWNRDLTVQWVQEPLSAIEFCD